MKHVAELSARVAWLRLVPAILLAMAALCPQQALAQVIALADEVAGIRARTGRAEPDVIT